MSVFWSSLPILAIAAAFYWSHAMTWESEFNHALRGLK